MNAVILLVALVVLFIDDDEAKLGIGQEQRRARTDDAAHVAARDALPDATAFIGG